MADITLTVGQQQRYQVAGLNAAGGPAALDENDAITLSIIDGGATIRQSARSHDEIVIGMPADQAVGSVSHLDVQPDGDPDPNVDRRLDLQITVTATRDKTNDAVSVGLTPVGGEEAINTPD